MRVKSSSPWVSPARCIATSGPMISWTSPPEQKFPPAPVSTTARTASPYGSARNRSRSSA